MKAWGQYRCDGDVLVAAVCDALPQQRAGVRQTALAGLSPSDGTIHWKLKPAGGVGSFALGEGRCFYSSGGDLVAIRIADSREVWRRAIGGPNLVAGSSQAFVAFDARTGRMWGADDPRLFAKAGRDETGKTVQVKRSVFGTKPIRFGREFSPVVVDGGVFVPGYRGAFFDLARYLETQFGATRDDVRKWTNPLPSGTLMVADDKVLCDSAGRLTALARTDGNTRGRVELPTDAAPLRDGVIAAENSIFVVTTAGEVLCLTAP